MILLVCNTFSVRIYAEEENETDTVEGTSEQQLDKENDPISDIENNAEFLSTEDGILADKPNDSDTLLITDVDEIENDHFDEIDDSFIPNTEEEKHDREQF